jgi:hypothetical protein
MVSSRGFLPRLPPAIEPVVGAILYHGDNADRQNTLGMITPIEHMKAPPRGVEGDGHWRSLAWRAVASREAWLSS